MIKIFKRVNNLFLPVMNIKKLSEKYNCQIDFEKTDDNKYIMTIFTNKDIDDYIEYSIDFNESLNKDYVVSLKYIYQIENAIFIPKHINKISELETLLKDIVEHYKNI